MARSSLVLSIKGDVYDDIIYFKSGSVTNQVKDKMNFPVLLPFENYSSLFSPNKHPYNYAVS
jgi:hypothetical protein